MPHLTYEYTDNIAIPNIDTLLQQSAEVLVAQGGVFPTGGIRVRAHKVEHYVIADGSHPSDAFVHAVLKIGKGRSDEEREQVCDALFTLMCEHFADAGALHGLALSLEYEEFAYATKKKNNIHSRYKKS